MNNQSDLSQFKHSEHSISIFAPVSIGNVSVGFDSLGMALAPIDSDAGEGKKLIGDIVHIHTSINEQDNLSHEGRYKHVLPDNFKDNIVWKALIDFNKALLSRNGKIVNIALTLEKNIPISSGLGSSSCSIVAALVALNTFYSLPFSKAELLVMMGELEGVITGSPHYDNVAPCYLGGLQLMLSDDSNKICQSIPTFDDCYWIIAYPDIEVSTRAAREILPKTYSTSDVVRSCQNIAGFVDACYRQDKQQAFSLLTDVIAEPYRLPLLPNFSVVKQRLLDNGCLSVGISGSGPTIFGVTDSLEKAKLVKKIMKSDYANSDRSIVEICLVDKVGTREIKIN